MKRIPFRISTLLFSLAVLIIITLGMGGGAISAPISPAAASTSTQSGGAISIHFTETEGSPESQPWTEEELLAAVPYPLERLPGEAAVSFQFEIPAGDPVFVPGSAPQGSTLETASQDISQDFSDATQLGVNVPPPYIRFENFDSYAEYPYSTVGVLFFKQNSVGYRCSAASIGNNAIWTAGHCVHAGDGLHESSDMIFIPAYKVSNDNSVIAPFGVWEGFAIVTHQDWETYADLRYDFGGVILNQNNGKKISEVVGSLGFAANLGNNRNWFNIGYPAAPPFDGRRQQICTGSFAFNDTNLNQPYPVGIGCDMTGGSSGGPWIYNFSGEVGSTNYLNGNNSYRYSEGPEEMFSPYFGSAAQDLYDELISIASP